MSEPQHKGMTPSGQDVVEMRRRARLLLSELNENEDTVVAPTTAASEWLTGIDRVKHGTFLAELESVFVLAPFDAPAAAVAAGLWQEARQLPKEDLPSRQCLKADVMIVATAKVAGARRFYSHEPKVRKLAKLAGMEGLDLPAHGSHLFSELPSPPPKKKPR